MAKRALVAYGSKHGATAEIAERIGAVLEDAGLEVSVRDAGEVKDPGPYDALVLGSAVYASRWRREASRLLKRRARLGSEPPTWIFSSGPLKEEPDREQHTPRTVLKAADRIGARDVVVFSGRLPLEPRNFIERSMVRNTPAEERDARRWDEIESWASSIAAELR